MSTNGNGNGSDNDPRDQIERQIRARFFGEDGVTLDGLANLMVQIAVDQALNRHLLESVVGERFDAHEAARKLPCETGEACPRLRAAEQRIESLQGGPVDP